MEEMRKKVGRPRTNRRHINLKAKTNLSGKEIRILLEKGLKLFIELKRIAFEQRDEKVREILMNDEELKEVLRKWEDDLN